MNELLALGLGLPDVIGMVTANAATMRTRPPVGFVSKDG